MAEPEVQDEFWTRARYRLGKLHLTPNEISVIERDIAQHVPLDRKSVV